jgi:stearoyl-CoA desaturase (delta-9 desaturase)
MAKAKRVVPVIKQEPTKTMVDAETLKALITYRFQLMSRYRCEVILPVLHEERKRASKTSRQILRRAKTALIRDNSIMKTSHQITLNNVLENFQALRIAYQFRIKLQEIWGRSTATQKELMDALQEWCQQAEATGIETLRSYSFRLKTYVTA